MDNSKYYIPEVEDYRVGYECECKLNNGEWEKLVVDKAHLQSIFFEDRQIQEGYVRVPFLTKEQIVNEGWEHYSNEHGKDEFKKAPHFLLTTYNEVFPYSKIRIGDTNGTKLYFGQIPSINELRHLQKLLKITTS